MKTSISFWIPLKTVPAGNSREHPMARHKRVKKERLATAMAVLTSGNKPFLRGCIWAGKVIVTLTRVSPRKLDLGDNLPMSLKSCRDQLAKEMGIDDGDSRVAWIYLQARGVPRERRVLAQVETLP